MDVIVIFDIDGVVRDVSGSYRRALADTVEHYTGGAYRPTSEDIDQLKSEGTWNNDWEGSRELIYRYFETQGTTRDEIRLDYEALVAFFQSRYRGANPHHWDGYITTEPLLLRSNYLKQLTQSGITWGFFSGATRGSAEYILQTRLGLNNPPLIAMEDAPGKPDPTGLFKIVEQVASKDNALVLYVGDTVADMYTVEKASSQQPQRRWLGVGILPPHVQGNPERQAAYTANLMQAGASIVLPNVEQLTPYEIQQLIDPS
jgi:HAD superfamily phosphatase